MNRYKLAVVTVTFLCIWSNADAQVALFMRLTYTHSNGNRRH